MLGCKHHLDKSTPAENALPFPVKIAQRRVAFAARVDQISASCNTVSLSKQLLTLGLFSVTMASAPSSS